MIGYLPTWRKDLDYNNAAMYQGITHGIIAFLQFDEKNPGELDQTSAKDQGGRAKSKGAHPAGSALVLFAQKLKAAMPGKLISVTLFATPWYGNNYDYRL